MDLVSILFAVGLALLVGAFIASPLLGNRRRAPGAEDDNTSALRAEHESVLAALRELDFDHATGKVAPDDYAPQRAPLVARGVSILQQLDALVETPAASAEAQLEAEVSAARARRTSELRLADSYCPRCGTRRQADDRFCAKCGASLSGDV